MAQGGRHDPFAVADQPTYRAECLTSGATAHRIDYLLVAGAPDRVQVTEARHLLTGTPRSDGPGLLSDHLALLVRLDVVD
ncbi:hypothetical protein ACWKSP_27340 [Micromonosporaceae bacterium Da 78-11]